MPHIDIADKQTLDNTKTVVDTVNTKIGVNTDVGGTTTLFARLRQIYEYLTTHMSSTRMAKVDDVDTTATTINTKVGTNADLAGTTTVFARVRQIYEYMVNTLLVAINGRQASWGAVAGTKTNIDNTAATVGTINTNVNTINTKIGASTDTGTTTLFGVVKNSGGTDWSKLTYGSSVRVNSTGLVRSVSSGKGYFSVIAHHGSGGTAQTITITVDGVVLMDGFLHRYSSVCVTPWIRYNSSYNVTITAGSSENSCRVLEGAE